MSACSELQTVPIWFCASVRPDHKPLWNQLSHTGHTDLTACLIIRYIQFLIALLSSEEVKCNNHFHKLCWSVDATSTTQIIVINENNLSLDKIQSCWDFKEPQGMIFGGWLDVDTQFPAEIFVEKPFYCIICSRFHFLWCLPINVKYLEGNSPIHI